MSVYQCFELEPGLIYSNLKSVSPDLLTDSCKLNFVFLVANLDFMQFLNLFGGFSSHLIIGPFQLYLEFCNFNYERT